MSGDFVGSILTAIRENKRLDFSDAVLLGVDARAGSLRPLMGPVLSTLLQQFPRDEPNAGADELTTDRFEALSLAARANLLGTRFTPDGETPEWVRNVGRFVEVRASDIELAVHAAAASGRADWGLRKHGLQIVGARILGDIDLVNCNLPFSLRLIGCVIDGSIRVNHGRLLTLDLSGSALRGLFGTYISCRSVRLRRTFSTSVVDFGGARIVGVFDASDCVVIPKDGPPTGEAFVGDRGVFNCSLAQIENEMRLNRARIYGGITLKGAIVHRSVFMNQAILRSPLAVLETLAFTMLGKPDSVPASVRSHGGADDDFAVLLHGGQVEAEFDWRVRLERLVFHEQVSATLRESRLLRRLLGEGAESRACSIRANGAEVRGSLFCRGLRSGGGVALKYLKVNGSVYFDGARLRSSHAVGAGIETIRTQLPSSAREWVEVRLNENLEVITAQGRGDDERYAVDLRHARLEGDCRFGLYQRQRPLRQSDDVLYKEVRESIAATAPFGDVALKALGELPAWPRKCLVIGSLTAEGAAIGGRLDMREMVVNVFPPEIKGVGPFVDVSRASIGGDIDFTRSIGIAGVCASYARVVGSVRFCSEAWHERGEDLWHGPKESAAMVSGVVDCVGAEILGDGFFVFSDRSGPTLRLQRCKFGGGLNILPADGDLRDGASDFQSASHPLPPISAAEASTFPEIDLRNASAAVFAHPRVSWPRLGRLIVEGFDYERVRSIGPLAPLRRREAAWSFDRTANGAALGNFLGALVLLSILSLPVTHALDLGEWLSPLVVAVGETNLTFGAVFALALLLLEGIRSATKPSRHDAKPLAILWLELQQQRPNEYRVQQFIRPLQPYTQAARVLRAAGRYQAANWVELERLRARAWFLSSRNDFGVKLGLRFADALTRYGFRPLRTVAYTTGIGIVGAMIFHSGDMCAQMHPTADRLVSSAYLVGGRVDWKKYEAIRVGPGGELERGFGQVAGAPYPAFDSLVYAFDAMVPIFDFGQEAFWAPSLAPIEKDIGRPAFCNYLSFVYLPAYIALKLLGWLLASAIAVAILARAEVISARNEE